MNSSSKLQNSSVSGSGTWNSCPVDTSTHRRRKEPAPGDNVHTAQVSSVRLQRRSSVRTSQSIHAHDREHNKNEQENHEDVQQVRKPPDQREEDDLHPAELPQGTQGAQHSAGKRGSGAEGGLTGLRGGSHRTTRMALMFKSTPGTKSSKPTSTTIKSRRFHPASFPKKYVSFRKPCSSTLRPVRPMPWPIHLSSNSQLHGSE